jgi:hypothetical protein
VNIGGINFLFGSADADRVFGIQFLLIVGGVLACCALYVVARLIMERRR